MFGTAERALQNVRGERLIVVLDEIWPVSLIDFYGSPGSMSKIPTRGLSWGCLGYVFIYPKMHLSP